LTEAQRKDIEEKAKGFIEFAKFTLKIFNDVVLSNKTYVDIILNGPYSLKIYSMGLVDENNKVNFYDGKVRVVDPDGKEHCKYAAEDYRNWVEERIEPYSYLKYPYLKQVGWKGFVEGKDSGVYQATPLARLNVADGMATPLAQEHYEQMYKTLGGKPVNSTLAMHWARLVELLYAAERALELAQDKEITSPDIQAELPNVPKEGVGIVEAQRGTLTHHYWTDEKGIITKANIIVGTTNNNAPISMSLKKAAQGLIKKGVTVNEGILNMVEMAFRAYDPCFSCATHSLPGNMPLEVIFRDAKGNITRRVKRN
jgi:F420-non-reducing hydrogenase large subunit